MLSKKDLKEIRAIFDSQVNEGNIVIKLNRASFEELLDDADKLAEVGELLCEIEFDGTK